MKAKVASILFSTAVIAGCSSKTTQVPEPAQKQVTLFEFMTQKIDKDADVIWGIGNKAIDNNASLDPSLMSEADWTRLKEAAGRMGTDARALAAVDKLIVKPQGVSIADEGTPGAPTTAEIEGHIGRDHDLFRSLAGALAGHADELASASAKRDSVKAARLINELDGVCESCHLEFWYPEQKKIIQQMGIKTR